MSISTYPFPDSVFSPSTGPSSSSPVFNHHSSLETSFQESWENSTPFQISESECTHPSPINNNFNHDKTRHDNIGLPRNAIISHHHNINSITPLTLPTTPSPFSSTSYSIQVFQTTSPFPFEGTFQGYTVNSEMRDKTYWNDVIFSYQQKSNNDEGQKCDQEGQWLLNGIGSSSFRDYPDIPFHVMGQVCSSSARKASILKVHVDEVFRNSLEYQMSIDLTNQFIRVRSSYSDGVLYRRHNS